MFIGIFIVILSDDHVGIIIIAIITIFDQIAKLLFYLIDFILDILIFSVICIAVVGVGVGVGVVFLCEIVQASVLVLFGSINEILLFINCFKNRLRTKNTEKFRLSNKVFSGPINFCCLTCSIEPVM